MSSYSATQLNTIATRLIEISGFLNSKPLDKNIQNILSIIENLPYFYSECVNVFGQSTTPDFTLCDRIYKQISECTNNQELSTVLAIVSSTISIMVKNAQLGYMPRNNYLVIPNIDIKTIIDNIKNPRQREVNILVVENNNIFNWGKEQINNNLIKIYAIKQELSEYKKIKKECTKAIAGKIEDCSITNNSFDIVYFSPRYYYESYQRPEINGSYKEKLDLQELTNRLRPEGYMIMHIPAFRMVKTMRLFIAKNYSVEAIVNTSYLAKDTIILVLKKNRNKIMDNELYNSLSDIYDLENFELLTDDFPKLTLPIDTLTIHTFKGSIVDEDEYYEAFNESKNINTFWEKQDILGEGPSAAQPLLPFNEGQLGLVLASGCLDGIIEENTTDIIGRPKTYKHLIKGRVIRYTDYTHSENGMSVETVSNKVTINVITGDGTIKTLA